MRICICVADFFTSLWWVCSQWGICCRIHWAPVSSSLSPYGWIYISPLHIINSASSPESFWLHISLGPLDLAGSDGLIPWRLILRPLLLSPSICLMDHGGLDRGPCLLPTIHTLCHTHWMCCYSVMIPSVSMTSIVLSILARDPPLLLSWRFPLFFPCERFFLSLGNFSWSDVRFWDRDVYVYRL